MVDAMVLEAAIIGLEQMKRDVDQKVADIRSRLGTHSGAGASQASPKRTLSAAARRRIAAAQKKRWAAIKAKQTGPKRGISAAGRRRIAAAQRKRWALAKAKKAATVAKSAAPKKMALAAS